MKTPYLFNIIVFASFSLFAHDPDVNSEIDAVSKEVFVAAKQLKKHVTLLSKALTNRDKNKVKQHKDLIIKDFDALENHYKRMDKISGRPINSESTASEIENLINKISDDDLEKSMETINLIITTANDIMNEAKDMQEFIRS